MTTTPLRAALYARVSSEGQAKDHTIGSQVEALHARSQADGLPIEPSLTFLDDGCSGSHLIRPALERLRDHAAAGAFDRLYVHAPDRLARDYAHQMLLVEELQRCGVELVFLNFPLDESPEGRLMLQVQSVVAEYERAKILERSRRGKRHAARSGRVGVLGHAPYGYRYIRKCDGEGEARYQVVLEAAAVVRRLFEWVAFEGLSLREVSRRLAAEAIPSPSGLPHWNPNTLGSLLQNPAYKGEAQFGKSRNGPPRLAPRPRRGAPAVPRHPRNRLRTGPAERVAIAVPALVDPEVFELVGRRLARNKARPGRRPAGGRALLRGLLVCMKCGYAYYTKGTGRRRTGDEPASKYLYYRCPGRDRTRFGGEPICDGPMLAVDRLDAAVWDDVRGVLSDPARVRQEYERRLSQLGADREARAGPGKPAADLKRRISRLLEMYEEGYLEKEEFRPRIEAARARLSRLEEEAKAARARAEEVAELKLAVGRLEEFAARVREGLEQGAEAMRRTIVESLVQEVQISEETIRVIYRVTPAPFAERPQRGVVPYCHASYKRRRGSALITRAPAGSTGEGSWDEARRPGASCGCAARTILSGPPDGRTIPRIREADPVPPSRRLGPRDHGPAREKKRPSADCRRLRSTKYF